MKLITIDFWNTLFSNYDSTFRNNARLKVLETTLKDIGVELTDSKFDEILSKSHEYYNSRWINEMRTPTANEIINYLWKSWALPDNKKAIDYVIDFFEKSIIYLPPKLEPDAIKALEILSDKYKLGIVSDTGFSPGWAINQMLEDKGLIKYFSAFSYSDETGVAKPHPKAFNYILEKMKCPPSEALHIGDIDRTDINGAKGVGMFAVRYDGAMKQIVNNARIIDTKADFIAKDWDSAVEYILNLK